ncbi:MAG: HPF/RaiA family ribosome-associated protein [Spirosomataceae bacterium]
MKIQMNAVHFTADNSLLEFIQRKLDKIETFYGKIISGEVFLRLDKGDKINTHTKHIEVKLNVPGSTLFVSEKGSTFEEATDIAVEVLSRKIKRFKEKKQVVSRVRPEITPLSAPDDEIEID